MTRDVSVLRRGWSPWALAILTAMVASMALPAMATAVSWSDENEMRESSTGRDTFIYDPGRDEEIKKSEFVQPLLANYYDEWDFDANFLNWAKIEEISPKRDWAGCKEGPHLNPCPISLVHFRPVSLALTEDSSITALHWKDAFISTVCGNFSEGGGKGPMPKIAGVKYEDLNADGDRDAGEPGLGGWTIRLRHGGKVVATTTTAANGKYSFRLNANEGMDAGTYRVEEVLKPGWVAEEAPGAIEVPLGSKDKTFGGNDFGNFRPAELTGHKFDDSNVNGVWDSEEVGLPDWAISLSNGEKQLTDSEGAFSFSVRPGTYTVSETLKEGWRQTVPGEPGTETHTVISGQVVDDIEFGNVCLGALSVEAVDEDTGEPVPMEIRLEEVSVPGILENEPSLPRTMTGIPTFDELLPGTYRVVAFLPEGYYTIDSDVRSVEGDFAIVKEIEVRECVTEELKLGLVKESTPGKVTGGMLEVLLPEGFATSGFVFDAVSEEEVRGVLQYNEHDDGPNPDLNLHTNEIALLRIYAEDEAIVWGTVDADGEPQGFYLRLVDAGEPGTSDRYELELDGGYSAGKGETLIGGNIQIHNRSRRGA